MNRDFKGVWIPREVYLAKDLSWSEKILLIEIDSLDNDPEKGCYASNGHFAEFLGVSPMTISNMISKLRQAGYIQQLFFDGKNRGLRSRFHGQNRGNKSTKNLHKIMEHKLHKKMNDAPQKSEPEAPQKHGQSNTSKSSLTKQEEEGRNARPKTATDERKDHAAIVAVRLVTNLFPPKEIWDVIIAAIGDDPDAQRLNECFIAWRTRGFKPNNYAWALEWYRHGIPSYAAAPKPFDPGRRVEPVIDEEPFIPPLVKNPRPADPHPAEQDHAWHAVRDELQKRLNVDVFNTWFKPVTFDGFNAGNNALKVRAGRVTHDWIKLYYSELLYETLVTCGLSEFTFQWEIEDEELEAAA